MSKPVDVILAAELQKLGVLGGALGGAVGTIPWGGVGLIGGALGGGIGVAWVAKNLPLEEFVAEFHALQPAESVLRTCADFLASSARLLDNNDLDGVESGDAVLLPTIRAITGGGVMNMNPVFVMLQCKPVLTETSGTHVHVYCASKEGLIKQHAAEKMGKQIIQQMKAMLDAA